MAGWFKDGILFGGHGRMLVRGASVSDLVGLGKQV